MFERCRCDHGCEGLGVAQVSEFWPVVAIHQYILRYLEGFCNDGTRVSFLVRHANLCELMINGYQVRTRSVGVGASAVSTTDRNGGTKLDDVEERLQFRGANSELRKR